MEFRFGQNCTMFANVRFILNDMQYNLWHHVAEGIIFMLELVETVHLRIFDMHLTVRISHSVVSV